MLLLAKVTELSSTLGGKDQHIRTVHVADLGLIDLVLDTYG